MLKDFFLVGVGSFMGGSLRFLASRAVQAVAVVSFPWGTLTVNVVGCLLMGLFSGLDYHGNYLSPSVKLLLTTGFCGGFTTFSTFMNENNALLKDGNFLLSAAYICVSLGVGFVCLVIGNQIAKII